MKKILIIVMLLLLSTTVSFAAESDVTKLTATCIQVPTDVFAVGLHAFADRVKYLSGGKLIIDVYDSAQLYAQDAELNALSQGLIDISSDVMGERPEVRYAGMFKSAFLFSSWDHAKRFYNSELGQALYDDFSDKRGYRPIGAMLKGHDLVNLRDIGKTVTTPQDLKGVKLRMPDLPDWLALGEALGANATPLGFNEVYMGLKTGTIDGQCNGFATTYHMKFYEVTKTFITTGHFLLIFHPIVNTKRWESLSDEQRGWIQTASDEMCDFVSNETVKQENEYEKLFKELGKEIIEPDKQAFIEYAENYYKNNKKITEYWDWDLYKKIKDMAD